MYSSTSNARQRHRAVPLFSRPGLVGRLDSPPVPYGFGSPKISNTNNFTATPAVVDRVTKALGHNMGNGPIWELLEDRSWFKEGEQESEDKRRPVVYDHVRVKPGWEILDDQAASYYLPNGHQTPGEDRSKPSSSVSCSFGPVLGQTRVELPIFQTRRLCLYTVLNDHFTALVCVSSQGDFIPESKAHVFNAGAPIWGLDWCPVHVEDRSARSFKQYLAVAPFPSFSHSPVIGHRVTRPSRACIQIWTLGRIHDDHGTSQSKGFDRGQMKCEMVLCLDGGPAQEIRWCPLPSHDRFNQPSHPDNPRKLGLLAGTFEDGSLSVYVVPEPEDMTVGARTPSAPTFVHLPEPLVRIEMDETTCWCLDWGNSERLAVGCSNGAIAIYNIAEALKSPSAPPMSPLPTHYFSVHQSAVRAVVWVRTPPFSGSGEVLLREDPTVVASGGYDGMECIWDLREMGGNVMNRTRDVINAMAFSPFISGLVTIDHENIIKTCSLSPTTLGRGHELFEPAGPTWSLSASDYHPQLAVGSADGACTTVNMLRSTRRSAGVPFFIHKIYQMDYSRKSGEYRMLDCFLPQIRPTTHTNKPGKEVKGSTVEPSAIPTDVSGTGAWPTQVGVHRVSWNSGNGLSAAGLLGSGTASGLGRVDWLEGRWLKGRVPYVSVANMRKEVELGVSEEDDEDEGDEDD